MALNELIAVQERWAHQRWPRHSGRRAPSLNANLIVRMVPEVRSQFRQAAGGELGRKSTPGKMASLRSSSALAYNFFAPWIGRDLTPLARGLGVSIADSSIQFERKFRHGLPSIPPNIDVVLDNAQPRPLGIECKFTEPYGPHHVHSPLDIKYFPRGRERWTEQGLPQCQELARNLGKGTSFNRLGAGQLLKHLLGLAYTTRQPPRLLCLWFDAGDEEAVEHRAELERFRSYVDATVDLAAISYQEVFGQLRREAEPIPGYHEYLMTRYFAA